MLEPLLNIAMREHPRGEVRVYSEDGKLVMGTTCAGYLAEQEHYNTTESEINAALQS